MLFEQRPVSETKNTLLVHSIRLSDTSLKKGHMITAEDIQLLSQEGIDSIIVAVLQEGDIGENEAALMLASELAGQNLHTDKAFTGRCNLYANSTGVLQLNEDAINRINYVHESMTVATLPDYSLVQNGQMVATIKIIPYGVTKGKLVDCLQTIQQHLPVIELCKCVPKKAGLIQSHLSGMKKSILDKTQRVLKKRLEDLNSELVIEERCEHDESSITSLIHQCMANQLDILIISSASAITDRRDVVPAAISASGGVIKHFGMPVDPGNLLLLAEKDNLPIMGMPGCARSPKLNGFDFVLQRFLADIPISDKDIMSMGVGGLLKEITSRPQKREKTDD